VPIHETASGGWQWGQHGHVYATRAGAEKQAAAAHANGYAGDAVPRAAGVMCDDGEGRVLFLRRSATADHPGTWCFPGGGAEDDEEPEDTAWRELVEETAYSGQRDGAGLGPVHAARSPVNFHTFGATTGSFLPRLNDEHDAYAWAHPAHAPQPLHPGVAAMFDDLAQAQDAKEWEESKHPRKDNGEFGQGGSGGFSGKEIHESDQLWEDYGFGSAIKDASRGQPAKVGQTTVTGEKLSEEDAANINKAAQVLQNKAENSVSRHPVLYRGQVFASKDAANLPKRNQLVTLDSLTAASGEREVAEKYMDPQFIGEDTGFQVLYRFSTADRQIKGYDRNSDDGFPETILPKGQQWRADRMLELPGGNGVIIDMYRSKPMLKDDKKQAQDAKVSKASVQYSVGMGAKRCFNCAHYRGDNECEIVEGTVAPEYWCERFLMDQLGGAAAMDKMALDKRTVREFDADGRLRVALTPISKANVCPYKGSEIPGYVDLGLDPDKIYQLYRHPDELAKAVPSFNGVPLLSEHVPVTVDAHRPELVVGYTGTDAMFEAPYLKNSLVVITRDAIDGIEDDTKKELSSAYRYRADMTPGSLPDGTRYDGVMRDIVANHVALVKEGRAGPDVVVGDGITEELARMSKSLLSRTATLVQGALLVSLPPMLAQDAKLDDLTKVLQGVTAKNFKEKKASILEVLKPRLAKDAKMEDLATLLDHFGGGEEGEKKEGEDDDPPMDPGDKPGEKVPGLDDGMSEKIATFLRDKLSPEDLAACLEMMRADGAGAKAEDDLGESATSETGETGGAGSGSISNNFPAGDKDNEENMSKKDVEAAMDAAIKKAKAEAAQNQREIREAEKAVRPYVGELAVACDSAEQVYREALTALGVEHAAVKDAAALPILLKAQQVPGARKPAIEPVIAADEAAVASYDKMFPKAARVASLG
jgi:hypothetical protein